MTRQKAHLVMIDGTGHVRGLEELNVALSRGWTFVSAAPLGGGSSETGCLATLVLLQRDKNSGGSLLETVEEEAEELLDDLMEGDGANHDLDIDSDT